MAPSLVVAVHVLQQKRSTGWVCGLGTGLCLTKLSQREGRGLQGIPDDVIAAANTYLRVVAARIKLLVPKVLVEGNLFSAQGRNDQGTSVDGICG